MKFVTKVIFLHARPYEIRNEERVDEETGEVLTTSGINVKYIGENLLPQMEEERGTPIFGTDVFKANIEHKLLPKLAGKIPGVFTIEMKQKNVKIQKSFNGRVTEQEIQRNVPVDILDYHGELRVTVEKPKKDGK